VAGEPRPAQLVSQQRPSGRVLSVGADRHFMAHGAVRWRSVLALLVLAVQAAVGEVVVRHAHTARSKAGSSRGSSAAESAPVARLALPGVSPASELDGAARRAYDGRPPCRRGHACATVGRVVVLFGGSVTATALRNDTWMLSSGRDAAGGAAGGDGSSGLTSWSWQYITGDKGGPAARWGATLTAPGVANGQGEASVRSALLFGGALRNAAGQDRVLDDAWEMELPAAEEKDGAVKWRALLRAEGAAWPPARRSHSCVAFGASALVIFGGVGQDGVPLGDTWVLDLRTTQWSPVVLPEGARRPAARQGHSAVAYPANEVLSNAKVSPRWAGRIAFPSMIVYGGRARSKEVADDVWALTLGGGGQWVLLDAGSGAMAGDLSVVERPSARSFHSAVIRDGFMFIFGGRTADLSHVFDDLWVFSVVEAQWTRLGETRGQQLVGPRTDHCAVLAGPSRLLMLVVAGADAAGRRRNDVDSFDLELDRWAVVSSNLCEPPAPTAILVLSLCILLGGAACMLIQTNPLSKLRGYRPIT
jgi:hypothetical protein